MFPAQWRDVTCDFVWRADISQRHFELAGVPQDDGGDEQVEAGGAIGLVLEPPITQFAELVGEERACERVAGLALVAARLGTTAQINVAQPVEHDDRAVAAGTSTEEVRVGRRVVRTVKSGGA